MKKLLLLLFIVPFYLYSIAQVDSARIRISGIILKGKDAKVVSFFVATDIAKYPTLDSLVKVLFASTINDGDNVTFNSVPNIEWFRIYKRMSTNPTCQSNQTKVTQRFDTEVRLHGSTWLIYRLDLSNADFDADNAEMKKSGQKFAQKQDDTND